MATAAVKRKNIIDGNVTGERFLACELARAQSRRPFIRIAEFQRSAFALSPGPFNRLIALRASSACGP